MIKSVLLQECKTLLIFESISIIHYRLNVLIFNIVLVSSEYKIEKKVKVVQKIKLSLFIGDVIVYMENPKVY